MRTRRISAPTPVAPWAHAWQVGAQGRLALVESICQRLGEKASSYSAVCLETGEVEAMELDGTRCSETSVAFLNQLRAKHAEPLIVI